MAATAEHVTSSAAAAADPAAVPVPGRDPVGRPREGGRTRCAACWAAWSGRANSAMTPRPCAATRSDWWRQLYSTARRKRRNWRRHRRGSRLRRPPWTGVLPLCGAGRRHRRAKQRPQNSARPTRRRAAAPNTARNAWRTGNPACGGAGAGTGGRRPAQRQKRGTAAAARERQAELERPTGAGTIAQRCATAWPAHRASRGDHRPFRGDATEGGPATGISYRAPRRLVSYHYVAGASYLPRRSAATGCC